MKSNSKLTSVFNTTAESFDSVAQLPAAIGERLLERVAWVQLEVNRVLDLGTGTGNLLFQLQDLFPQPTIMAVDIAFKRLKIARGKVCSLHNEHLIAATAYQLPFPKQSFDLIVSNLVLHWCVDLNAVFQELHRILRPNGLFLFSVLGPDTLHELQTCWRSVDNYDHINSFVDMHNVGDLLVNNQFLDPVMDREVVTVNYSDMHRLLNDIKALGSLNLAQNKRTGFTGRGLLKQLAQAYECLRQPQGKLPASFEIIYGHARGKQASGNSRVEEGNEISYIPISHIHGRTK